MGNIPPKYEHIESASFDGLQKTPRAAHTHGADTNGSVVGESIQLQFNLAKGNDAGEDADPIIKAFVQHRGLLAVFDGLGGSGSEIYAQYDGRERTGAYIASRIVRNCVKQYCTSDTIPVVMNANALNPLKVEIQNTVNQYAAMHPRSGSRILSNMRRTLPTTMASVFYAPAPQGHGHQCDVVWAGDSRIFCLTPHAGLQQLTRDHVKGSTHDTLQDFVQDSPISNCIQANAEFTLEHKRFVIDGPLLLIAATDGCYSALASPAHFEHILLTELMQSTRCGDWSTRLQHALGSIAQDDVSMSIVGLGVTDFADVQRQFRNRTDELARAIYDYRLLESPTSANTQLLDMRYASSMQKRLETFWQERYHRTYTARLKEYTHER